MSRLNVWVEECAAVCLPVSAAPLMIKSHSGMGHFAIKCSVGAQGVTLATRGWVYMGTHQFITVRFTGISYVSCTGNVDIWEAV